MIFLELTLGNIYIYIYIYIVTKTTQKFSIYNYIDIKIYILNTEKK